ncbi:MAG: iron-containing alcohol dehydrogenase, partial [Fidelibacterota bacterium]
MKYTFWKYYLPTEVIFGVNSLSQLPFIVKNFDTQSILLVTGCKSMFDRGIVAQIHDYLSNCKINLLKGIKPNPSFEDIKNSLKFAKRYENQLIIALGGGSVIDTAKALSILLTNDKNITGLIDNPSKIINKGIPLIAIPTTAGTGSEVTPFATIWDRKNKLKYSLNSRKIYPKTAIIDPELSLSLSPYQTACTGLDALTHAIEAYWSRNSQPVTDCLALEAISLISENLLKVHHEPDNIKARTNMMNAS